MKELEELKDIARAVEHTMLFNAHVAAGLPILEALMPDGKSLGECTGEELGRIGAWLQRSGRELEALRRAHPATAIDQREALKQGIDGALALIGAKRGADGKVKKVVSA